MLTAVYTLPNMPSPEITTTCQTFQSILHHDTIQQWWANLKWNLCTQIFKQRDLNVYAKSEFLSDVKFRILQVPLDENKWHQILQKNNLKLKTQITSVCSHQRLTPTTGFIQTLKCFLFRTFQDLQRPNSRVFRDSRILFSRTFEETFHSKHWLHEVKKCIYKIGYQCICIEVKKWKCNTWGCIIVLQWTQIRPCLLYTSPSPRD